MKPATKARLEKAGWRVGTADGFLNLSQLESALVEMRLMLAGAVRNRRLELGVSQTELARRLGSSQTRVAKMEAGEPDVSIDLLIWALLLTGAQPAEIGLAMTRGSSWSDLPHPGAGRHGLHGPVTLSQRRRQPRPRSCDGHLSITSLERR